MLLASALPVYYVNTIGVKFSVVKNRTVLGLIFKDIRGEVEKISTPINNVFTPLAAFLSVIVCTVTLVVSMNIQSEWRKRSTHSGQAGATSSRDQKVTRMIVVVAVVFIASNFPLCVIITALILVPDLAVDGEYVNTVVVFCGFGFLLDSVSCSMNIFVYYHMSSRYRSIFRQTILGK